MAIEKTVRVLIFFASAAVLAGSIYFLFAPASNVASCGGSVVGPTAELPSHPC